MALTILTCLPFVACSSDDDAEDQELLPQELTSIRVVAPDFLFDHSSRVTPQMTDKGFTISWQTSDTLGIMPYDGAQMPFPITNGITNENSNEAVFNGGSWALKNSKTYAAYYPYIGDIYLNKRNIPVDYTGQWQQKNNDYGHLGPYIYMAANATVPNEGKVQILLQHIGCYALFEINTPEPTKFAALTLTAEEEVFPLRGHLDMAAKQVKLENPELAKEISFNLEGVETTSENLKASLYFMLGPTKLTGKTVTAILRDTDGYEEKIEISGKELLAGKAYRFNDLKYVTYPTYPQPNWSFDDKNNVYQSGMTAVVTVPQAMKKLMGPGDELSAYLNNELRGVGKIIDGAYYMIVHGNIGEKGKVSFKYYNQKKKYLYEAKEVVDFNTDLIFGVTDHPKVLPLEVIK